VDYSSSLFPVQFGYQGEVSAEMNNKNTGDQSKIILLFTIVIMVSFALICFIPPFCIGKFEVRRVNVFSDFLKFEDSILSTMTSRDLMDTSCLLDISADLLYDISMEGKTVTAPDRKADDCCSEVEIEESISEDSDTIPGFMMNEVMPDWQGLEDFSPSFEMTSRLAAYFNEERHRRSVHIAFLGDSFIESDILTCNLRTDLQKTFGGEGVGYIPFADPRAANRPTINQTHSGWTVYSLLKKKKAPAKYAEDFCVNGYICIPVPGAKSVFTAREYASIDCSGARVIFKNRGAGIMNLVINDSDTLHYDLKISGDLQQVYISGMISSLEINLPVCDDFIGYGVEFEGRNGICVDNYALRSHSGLNLISTSRELNTQYNKMVSYDVIVLEYGLNVMQKNVTDYTYFESKMRNIINFVRLCFPESVIIVMSVGDVGMNKDGKVVTAPSVQPLLACQRQAAIDTGVMFWDTLSAMSGDDSMVRLVEKGWASKDYTHIGFKGGEMLSAKMASSFRKAIINYTAI